MATQEPQLHRHLDQLVTGLRDLLPAALHDWDADAIHDARVATRRLRAALDVLSPALPGPERRRFGKVLRKLRRRLGPLRDLDVMGDHLKDLTSHARHPRAAAWVADHFDQQRQSLHKRITRKYPLDQALESLGTWWVLRAHAKNIDAQVPPLLRQTIPQQLASFADQAAGLSQASHAPESTETHDPHALRIAGKLLRYTLELTAATGLPLQRSVLKTFKKLQDALGLWHDYVVLSQRILQLVVENEVACHDQALYSQLLDLARTAWRRAQAQLRHFTQLWQHHGQPLHHEIASLFPPAAPETPPPAPDPPPATPDSNIVN